MLYDRYVFAVEMGEWGPYEALTPTENGYLAQAALGGGHVGE